MQVLVSKKDNTVEPWSSTKIIEAIKKAADRVEEVINVNDLYELSKVIYDKAYNYLTIDGSNTIHTSKIHNIVINTLCNSRFNKTGNAYKEYRDFKNNYSKSWEDIKKESERILFLGDNENANFDSSLISTKRSLIQGALTKELYKQFYLTPTEKALIKRGDIYIHDLRDMMLNSINCCLFDMGNVLKNGFSMCNVDYTEPKSVLSALQVIGDVTLVASSQQYGGFSIPEIDKVLLPYCKKTLDRSLVYAKEILNLSDVRAGKYAWDVLARELEQGFQSLELKLNTVK